MRHSYDEGTLLVVVAMIPLSVSFMALDGFVYLTFGLRVFKEGSVLIAGCHVQTL